MTANNNEYIHDALFFDGTDDLVAATSAFLRDGVEAGDDVVLICTDEHSAAMAAGVDDQDRIIRLSRADIYDRAPLAVSSYRRFVKERMNLGTSRVRLVGEVDFGRHERTWREWGRFESVCNTALAPLPLWCICAYDADTLPKQVLATAELTHPHVRRDGHRSDNPFYVDPAAFMEMTTVDEADPVEATAPAFADANVDDLQLLRTRLHGHLGINGANRTVVEDFLFAVNEVVTNALRYGRPPVMVQLWVTSDRFVCAVTDQGRGFSDPLAGYVAPDDEFPEGRVGLWLVRQLCDNLSTARSSAGFTVRVSTQHAT